MSSIKLLSLFKNQILSFCDELIEQFPEEGDFVILKLFVDGRVPIKNAIDGFTSTINRDDNKLRGMIKARNEKFFIEENPFSFISPDKVSRFSKMWLSSKMGDEDREVIWSWIDTFVTIADKYNKLEIN
jgi:hypothetical protein